MGARKFIKSLNSSSKKGIKEKLCTLHLDRNGRYHIENKQWSKAEKIYSSLVEIDDSYWVHLAECLKGQEKYQEAKECYEYALDKMPSDPELTYGIFKGLSLCHLFFNDNDAAEEFLNKARVLKRKFFDLELSLVQGILLKNKDEYEEAHKVFQQILEKEVECVEAWAYIAEVRAHLDDIELARVSLQKALDLNPENKTALKVKVRLSVFFSKTDHIYNTFSFRA